ncbi:MAG: sigma-54-dependent Fis family transcriptional regulator [Desulfobulbus sp.]|nr:MAG: sigma-54-dependent Fis family transcriptional regulator [Desulfobulbus sp.]
MTRILLAEDDEIMRITVQDRLERQGWSVEAAVNGQEALKKIQNSNFHIVVSDIRMPLLGGVELLAAVKEITPSPDVIMMTAYGSVDDAIGCLKKGATDYILKPFDMDDLVIRINRILANQSIKARCVSLEDCCRQMHSPLLGKSSRMRQVFDLIKQVGPTLATVLISGESGTGKELAAEAIHQASTRADKPYVRINCAAIPEGLIESELFGHERGAFTGAHKRKTGRFEMADSGTLLLDEIGELPLGLQAKLLRVLQEKECERVGGTRTIKLDVRMLCSTARNLEEEVKEGRFRQDLLYRLQVIPLTMPPLRERDEDISLLAYHFLKEFSINKGSPLTLAPQTMACLLNYSFPGNVRELRNIIERVSVLAPGPTILPEDLPAELQKKLTFTDGEIPVPLGEALAETEKHCVLNALNATEGNRTQAAALLGISRKNLWQKMKLYSIEI